MAEDTDALLALTRLLSPHCRVTKMSGGALIADWKRTRFLGMTADIRKLVGADREERAEPVPVSSGPAARRTGRKSTPMPRSGDGCAEPTCSSDSSDSGVPCGFCPWPRPDTSARTPLPPRTSHG
ncbi:hypothetical protein LT493_42470 [Streptomyces tricolor]|nr:hypothetical protein [Streptomyces tricolor]